MASAGTVVAIAGAGRTLGQAIDAFLAQPRAPTTRRTYGRTLERLAGQLGRDRPLRAVTDEELAAAVERLWGHRSRGRGTPRWPPSAGSCRGAAATAGPSAALRCASTGARWPTTTPRRSPWRSWSSCGAAPTCRSESGPCGGCCTTALPGPRKPLAWTWTTSTWPTGRPKRTKGGYVRQLHFQTAVARLLAKLVAGRERGPVFLTGRRAGQARPPAAGDLDTATGRARLSYEMAGQLFKRYAGGWHAAPAPPLPPDPPWRAERERAAADGHLPEPAVGGADSSPTGSPRQPPSPGRAAGRSRAPDA